MARRRCESPSERLSIVGTAEAAELLGIWPESFARLRRNRDGRVPEPDAVLKCGPIWYRYTIHDYGIRTGRITQ